MSEKSPEQFHIATETVCGFTVERQEILDPEIAAIFGVPIGTSWRIRTGPLCEISDISEAGECLAEILRPLLSPWFGKVLCICGLGNVWQLHDCLGPVTTARIPASGLASIHTDCQFSSIVTITPGVFGHTNLETSAHIASVVQAVGAAGVLLIDAEQTSKYENLCACIGVRNNGIKTGLRGAPLDQTTLPVPAVSIAVPTALRPEGCSDFVMRTTFREDVAAASRMIAYAVMRVAYPCFSQEDLVTLLKLAEGPCELL